MYIYLIPLIYCRALKIFVNGSPNRILVNLLFIIP